MKYKNRIIRSVILSVSVLSLFTVSYALEDKNSNITKETEELIQEKWVYNFGGSNRDYFISATETQDSGLVAVGYSTSVDAGFANKGSNDAIIIKYDSSGNQQWIKSFGGSKDDHFWSVIETQDSGLVAVGYSNSTDAEFTNKGYEDAVIVKYDSDGNQQWVKNFGGSKSERFLSVIEAQDGGLIAVGYSESTNAGFTNKRYEDAIIVKYDSDGNQQWVKNFGGSGFDYFDSVIETRDGGLIAVGESGSTNADFISNGSDDIIIVKYDSDGNQQWVKNFGGSGSDYLNSAIGTQDGGLVVVGESYSTDAGYINNGFSDAIVVKFDENGNQQWIKSIGGSNTDSFTSVIETQDRGIIAVGYSSSYNAEFTNKGSDDAIIVKYDSFGNQQWVKNFGGSSYDFFYSVLETQDGGIIAVGYSGSDDVGFINKGYCDAVIVKFKQKEEVKKATSNIDIYIKPETVLSMTLDTNSIIFEDFSSVDEMEKLNAVNLTISSNLPYELNAYLASEIQNADKSKTIDKQILNIKESSENDYKTFIGVNQKITLKENVAGNDLKHSIDLKLRGGVVSQGDVYKTTIKFEAQQK